MSKVVVVTGSNRGIGLAIVKDLCRRSDVTVYLTSRDKTKGKEAVAKLKGIGLYPEYHQLDISDRDSVETFRDHIKEKYGGFDVLINNAAIADADSYTHTYEDAVKVIDINYRSLFTLKQLLYPLIRDNGRVINMSSSCGHLSNIRNEYWIQKLSNKDLSESDVNEFVDWYLDSVKNGTFNREDIADEASVSAYRVSKVAVSAITIVHQRELTRNISINSMHPGVVKTDMTFGNGYYELKESTATPIYLALDAPQSLKGSFVWHDGRALDWYDYKANYYFKIKTYSE